MLRVAGAIVATLPVAVLASVCLATCVPGDVELRLMLGVSLAIPLWIFAMCAAFLAREAGRIWLWCGAASLILGVISYGVPL